MSDHFGPRLCGRTTYLDDAEWQEIVRKDPSACFASTGCPPGAPVSTPLEDCPQAPVLTVEELVRANPSTWAGKLVVVRGRLAFANGRTRSLMPSPAPPCDAASRILALEATVEGACYAVDVGSPTCSGDASRICCDGVPLGHEVAVAGRLLSGGLGEPFYGELRHEARLCRLTGSAPQNVTRDH